MTLTTPQNIQPTAGYTCHFLSFVLVESYLMQTIRTNSQTLMNGLDIAICHQSVFHHHIHEESVAGLQPFTP